MHSSQRTKTVYLTLVLLGVAFIAAVMASNALLQGMRIDLTENKLYTLSPGTRALVRGIDESINLYFFFSDREAGEIQFLRNYATRVRETLEEFEAISGGRLVLHAIDPLPFSEEEDRAAQYGLENINLGALGDSIYFGLAATNSIGDEAVIPVFEPSKETSLEYDLARLVFSLATLDKSVVGLLSGVPMSGGFDAQTQQPTQPWFISQQARQLFDIRSLPNSIDAVDDDINLLWIVHPTDLDEQTLYAIDQFILGGGRALIFVDPLAEIAAAASDPTGFGSATSSSSLEPLFGAWGLQFSRDEVVADNAYALSVDTGLGLRPIRHIGLLGLDGPAIDAADVVSAGLQSVNLGTAGRFTVADGAQITLSPLLTSSAESAVLPSSRFQFLPDPDALLDDFLPSGTQYVLAARLQGALTTAFPDGPPGDESDDVNQEGGEQESGEHLTSIDNANMILIADVDILSDRLWVQIQRSLFGQQLASAFASNGDFITNALANLSGSADLIGLRNRSSYSRPFDTVEALRRDADARFRATEQQLQAELAETERRLGELQSARDDTSSLLMSPEQQAELQRFRDEQLRIRRELRAVQRDLDSSIERLGVTLKVVNIVAVPLALTVLTLLVVLFRRRR